MGNKSENNTVYPNPLQRVELQPSEAGAARLKSTFQHFIIFVPAHYACWALHTDWQMIAFR